MNDAATENQLVCIEACHACAALCERLAAECLRSPESAKLLRCVGLLRNCADACLLTARLAAQESEFIVEYAALCAEVCHACSEECLAHAEVESFRQCATACLRCDQACQRMAV